MKITIILSQKQEKFLKHIYPSQNIALVLKGIIIDIIEKRIRREYISSKTIDQQIEEITK